MTTAIYAFSGDPITYGHINIVERARKVFDKVIVAIGENPDKKYTFDLFKRKQMAQECFSDPSIKVLSFPNLLVDFAYEQDADVIIKGVRNSADFDYESILHSVGQSQKTGIDTHILFADPELSHISSSAAKSIAKHSGNLEEYVPLHVKESIEEEICHQRIFGVTGEIGCGKSYIGQKIVKLLDKCLNSQNHNIELDDLGYQILNELTEPAYCNVRNLIRKRFGEEVMDDSGFINRKILGEMVFNNSHKLNDLNKIMAKPIMVRLRQEIAKKEGTILINCALLAESDMLHICNNNVILINTDKETRNKRLLDRGLTEDQIHSRLNCQYNFQDKRNTITDNINRDRHGHLWIIDNSQNINEQTLTDQIKGVLYR